MIKRFFVVILLLLMGGLWLAVDAKTTPKPQKIQNLTIILKNEGYSPSSFRLKKGVRTRLTFVRKTEDACGEEVVIPAFKVRRKLPLNQPVTITITPRSSGTFGFACGMDMFHGEIIVS